MCIIKDSCKGGPPVGWRPGLRTDEGLYMCTYIYIYRERERKRERERYRYGYRDRHTYRGAPTYAQSPY